MGLTWIHGVCPSVAIEPWFFVGAHCQHYKSVSIFNAYLQLSHSLYPTEKQKNRNSKTKSYVWLSLGASCQMLSPWHLGSWHWGPFTIHILFSVFRLSMNLDNSGSSIPWHWIEGISLGTTTTMVFYSFYQTEKQKNRYLKSKSPTRCPPQVPAAKCCHLGTVALGIFGLFKTEFNFLFFC